MTRELEIGLNDWNFRSVNTGTIPPATISGLFFSEELRDHSRLHLSYSVKLLLRSEKSRSHPSPSQTPLTEIGWGGPEGEGLVPGACLPGCGPFHQPALCAGELLRDGGVPAHL